VNEYDSADQVNAGALDDIEHVMALYGGGKGGRAFIVNEAHGLRRSAVRRLLGLLERIPRHVVFIFTTTTENQLCFFEDHTDAGPLLSRCIEITLTNQGLAKVFAKHVQSIAKAENLDGKPEQAYYRLAQDCKNNCRAMLQQVEAGMMKE
jgi:DNA polymerase III gamma/tau subunit